MEVIQASPFLLALLFSLHDRIENVVRLSIALHAWSQTESETFEFPDLHPTTLDDESTKQMKLERPNRGEIQNWLSDPVTREHIGTGIPGVRDAALKVQSQLLKEMLVRVKQDGPGPAMEWFRGQYER